MHIAYVYCMQVLAVHADQQRVSLLERRQPGKALPSYFGAISDPCDESLQTRQHQRRNDGSWLEYRPDSSILDLAVHMHT
jgi:hypothetical protein